MDLQAILEAIEGLKSQIITLQEEAEAKLAQVAKEEFDKGFAAGVASVTGNGDKIYSQAELDAKVSEEVMKAVEPVAAELEASKSQIMALTAELEALKAGLPVQLEEAKKAIKAEILAKYQAQQAAESEAEKALEAELSV